jgi:hypothetical protein
MTADPHASLRQRVLASVLDGPGESEAAVRRAASAGTGIPDDLHPLVAKIHKHAYKVTDDEVGRAQAKYGDDHLFEIIVSAALGASEKRLVAALKALKNA